MPSFRDTLAIELGVLKGIPVITELINEHDHAVLHHHADRAARLLHTEQLRREGVDDDWRRRCHGNQVRERERCRWPESTHRKGHFWENN